MFLEIINIYTALKDIITFESVWIEKCQSEPVEMQV